MFQLLWFVYCVALASASPLTERMEQLEALVLENKEYIRTLHDANRQQEDANQHLQGEINRLKSHYDTILHQQQKRIGYLETIIAQNNNRIDSPYNVTIEELEIRVERLEVDMFQAQTDINDAEGEIDSLQFSLQETIETVMDHSDNLDHLEQNVSNLESSFGGLENKTNDMEESVAILESNIMSLDVRTSDLEQINFETKDSAFYATLSSIAVFEEALQIIVFDNDKINEGGHYNVTTGTYTAPVSGVYQFYAYIKSVPKASFHIYVDGSDYVNPIEQYNCVECEDAAGEAEGASVIIKLQAGQEVQVHTGDIPYTVDGDADGVYSWFGGHLLFPDTV